MRPTTLFLALAIIGARGQPVTAVGDVEAGAQAFGACIACHTLEAGKHRTGPSLAGIFGRTAGTAPGFGRYSPALRRAGIVWDAATLDAWLTDPAALVPANRMSFRGIADAEARADLIAYLEQAAATGTRAAPGGMGGSMTGAVELADLRRDMGPGNRIASIRHCGDTYTVGVASGETHQFWEFNLRFKTDSSDRGPEPGRPVLIAASMMGDRAFVIFAAPGEISGFIDAQC
jgi:cytochrome c